MSELIFKIARPARDFAQCYSACSQAGNDGQKTVISRKVWIRCSGSVYRTGTIATGIAKCSLDRLLHICRNRGKPSRLTRLRPVLYARMAEFMHGPFDEFNSETLSVSRQFVKDTFYKHDWTRVFAIIEFTFIHLNPHWYDKSSL
jgi:hypothetical protein